jgi:dynein heavy chain
MKTKPNIDECDQQINYYAEVEERINAITPLHTIGALSLNTTPFKAQLRALNNSWRNTFAEALHRSVAKDLADLTDYFKTMLMKLKREPSDLTSIKYLMDTLAEVRDKEASIFQTMRPITDLYGLLDQTLPEGSMSGEEKDMREKLDENWGALRQKAEDVTEEIAELQAGFRKSLLEDVKAFKLDTEAFRKDFVARGPMVKGITAGEAQDRLRRFEDEAEIRKRKRELYANGEALFAIPPTPYEELDTTDKELALLGKLYSLYRDVTVRVDDWNVILWPDFAANVVAITGEAESFANRCKKMPKRLREWDAYTSLKDKIEEFQLVLPLLQDLSKPSIQPRHWEAVERITGARLPVGDPEFRLSQLLNANLVPKAEDITEVTDLADKETVIAFKLDEMDIKWSEQRLSFSPWMARASMCWRWWA